MVADTTVLDSPVRRTTLTRRTCWPAFLEPQPARNELMATISTSSCDQGIRADLAAFGPDSSIVDRLLLAACEAAQACRSLTANDRRSCASKLFDVPPESELSSAFVMAYQNELDAMAWRRQFEKRLATRA